MKKIVALCLLTTLLSCTPYQKLFLVPSNLHPFLDNSCDVDVVLRLQQVLDTTEYWKLDDPDLLLDHIADDTACTYFLKKIYHPAEEDSAIWLLTIRPEQVGKDEIILGNLYTFHPYSDTAVVFERRVKEYSQTKDFERGKYVGFTYYIENDSISTIKTGTRVF
jgi:hypothetical protein